MLPTVTSGAADTDQLATRVSTSGAAASPISAAKALDELLFEPSSWFVIDANNKRLKGVRVGTLAQGLDLVGKGPVATVVARVKPAVQVIDVDVPDVLGFKITDELVSWCERNDVWWLTRPSGGAEGRMHLFTVPGPRRAELLDLVGRLRARFRVPASVLDSRQSGHIRPLSAPHRRGGNPLPHGDLTLSIATLKRALRHATTQNTAPPVSATTVKALVPRPRKLAALPQQWASYLRTGAAPPHNGGDQSRSTTEMLATVALLYAGHTAHSAWELIDGAHPSAMTKARRNKAWWVRCVWNQAVTRDFDSAHIVDRSPEVTAAVAVAAERLEALAWSVPVRRRRALLLVGHQILDRMLRTNALRVPVPERDLVLDTGLTDRKTIRTNLRLLGAALGSLDRTPWDPTNKRETSSFEFEISLADESGLSQIPPPCFHPPRPRTPPLRPAPATPPGLWASLPGPAHALWRALLRAHSPVGLVRLLQDAALVQEPTSIPSESQLRRGLETLQEMASAGLVVCDASGDWVLQHAVSVTATAKAQKKYEELQLPVAQERLAYRRRWTSDWTRERARVLKEQVSREKAWWGSLSVEERQRRSGARASFFRGRAVQDQAALKAHWAARRARAGISEEAHYESWRRSVAGQPFANRAAERQHWFRSLSPQEKADLIASWREHRERFGVPAVQDHPRPVHEELVLMPSRSEEADEAFLDAQLVLSGELAVREGPEVA